MLSYCLVTMTPGYEYCELWTLGTPPTAPPTVAIAQAQKLGQIKKTPPRQSDSASQRDWHYNLSLSNRLEKCSLQNTWRLFKVQKIMSRIFQNGFNIKLFVSWCIIENVCIIYADRHQESLSCQFEFTVSIWSVRYTGAYWDMFYPSE